MAWSHFKRFRGFRGSGRWEELKFHSVAAIPFIALYGLKHSSFHLDCDHDDSIGVQYETNHHYHNWSSTHASVPSRVYEPSSAQEVVRVLKKFHQEKRKIRPVGTCLSPNGIGLVSNDRDAMISLTHLDHIRVDPEKRLVTVGAGATVHNVLKELKKHNLTLENFSSIQEQQMGGWTQVSAHGTGCGLPPVDEMIVSMTVALPTGALLPLSADNSPHIFEYAKVGLGSLGVVTELTLKCVPQFALEEDSFVLKRAELSKGHLERLRKYRHVRYMWIPYTDDVVAVVSNPTSKRPQQSSTAVNREATKPLVDLAAAMEPTRNRKDLEKLSFSQLRDILLDKGPLDLSYVKRVNRAEADYWRQMQGKRIDDSTNILGFDCGGEQWVYEVCLPMGELQALSQTPEAASRDIEFVTRLQQLLSDSDVIPAPSPIEQRWSGRSTAPMSPAHSDSPQEVFSWVGIIMYLPPHQTASQRQEIAKTFREYVRLVQPLVKEFKGKAHWAKIELPEKGDRRAYEAELRAMRADLYSRYPVREFNELREVVDPHHILSNELVDELLSAEREKKSFMEELFH